MGDVLTIVGWVVILHVTFIQGMIRSLTSDGTTIL